MPEETCHTCQYYRQHYTFDERKIFRVYCGHCTHQHPKPKRPHSKRCQYYIAMDPDHTPFVSKEYLSKALLEYMMQLELLPEIYTTQDDSESDTNHRETDCNFAP